MAVEFTVADGIARITLNRPERRNALGPDMVLQLLAAIEHVLAAEEVRVLFITGVGNSFCVGGDIEYFIAAGGSLTEGIGEQLGQVNANILKLAELPIPIVCAVNGSVGGGGIGVALCADIVLASSAAKLRGGYTGIGLVPDFGSSVYLTKRAGATRAKRIFLLNETLSADECLAWGIYDEVLPEDALAARAEELLLQLAQGPTLAMRKTKQLVEMALHNSVAEQLEAEQNAMVSVAGSKDAKEGFMAFMQKRKPNFQGE